MSERESVGSPTPVGKSGVRQWGGVLVHDDYNRAWIGGERDRTVRLMLFDPLIGAVLFGIEQLVRRVDWSLRPADESPAAADAATFVQECLDDMAGQWPGEPLAQILTAIGWGWAVMEMTFKRRDGRTGRPPSRYDDGRIGWHRWSIRPQATRWGWVFDGDDVIALIQQDPQTLRRYTIPLAKCLHVRVASRDNSPEGFTALRLAYDAWYNKRELQRIRNIGLERGLAGYPVGRVPGRDIEENSLVYQGMQTVVTGIRQDSQAGVVISSDRDASGNYYQSLDLLSISGVATLDINAAIKDHANEVVTVFLANVLRTGQDGVGSYALAETQGGLFQQAIGAHLDTIAGAINEQGIGPLCRLNGISEEQTPTLEHGDIESADLARLGTYIKDLAAAGMLEDTPELRVFLHEVAGIPVPTKGELEAAQVEREAEAKKIAGQQAQTPPADEEDAEEERAPNGRERMAGVA